MDNKYHKLLPAYEKGDEVFYYSDEICQAGFIKDIWFKSDINTRNSCSSSIRYLVKFISEEKWVDELELFLPRLG